PPRPAGPLRPAHEPDRDEGRGARPAADHGRPRGATGRARAMREGARLVRVGRPLRPYGAEALVEVGRGIPLPRRGGRRPPRLAKHAQAPARAARAVDVGPPPGRAPRSGPPSARLARSDGRRDRRPTRILQRAELLSRVPALDGQDARRLPAFEPRPLVSDRPSPESIFSTACDRIRRLPGTPIS